MYCPFVSVIGAHGRSIFQDVKPGKPVDVKLRFNIKVANEIFRMVLGYRFSGSIRTGAGEDQDAEGLYFRNLINELQQLKGLFLPGDFVPWLRPLDIGGVEKRMKAVQDELDVFLNKVLAEHEVKWQKGPIAESDKDMVDVLLRAMHEQKANEPSKLDEDCVKATVMVRSNSHHLATLLISASSLNLSATLMKLLSFSELDEFSISSCSFALSPHSFATRNGGLDCSNAFSINANFIVQAFHLMNCASAGSLNTLK